MGLVVILHLGVIDVPYATEGTTTGDVAEILEAKYDVMGNFDALHHADIEEVIAISLSEAIDSLVQGAPATLDPFGQACADVQQMFVTYLDNEEIAETGQAGVPTAAALAGVRTSLKKKKELKNPRKRSLGRRPSFIDTGMYRDSFKAWVD